MILLHIFLWEVFLVFVHVAPFKPYIDPSDQTSNSAIMEEKE